MLRRRLWSLMLLLTGFGLCPQMGRAQDMLPAPKEPVVTVTAAPTAGPIADSLRTASMGSACSGPGCAAAGIGCDSCEPVKQWTVVLDVGAVYMQRNRPNNGALVTDPAGTVLVRENSFNFDWEPGVDARLIADNCNGWGVELRYLWINDFNARTTATLPAGVSTIGTTPLTNFGGPGTMTLNYLSEIQSAEGNLRLGGDMVTFVSGFRYINLRESLTASTPFGATASVQSWRTRNELWGLQIGADARLFARSRFRVDSFVRAGGYLNDMGSSFQDTFAGVGNPAFGQDGSTQLAFAGEAGLFGTFNVTRNISLKGGYQALWLSGVALASEQVSTTGNFNRGIGAPPLNSGTTINRGDVLYHGARLGLEIRW